MPTTAPAVQEAAGTVLREVAYHHEPYWGPGRGNWIKTLLLFFEDGVAVLVPDYMRNRPLLTDPALAQPLHERGLLHQLSPEKLIDQATAEALTELLDDKLTAGFFDGFDRGAAFAKLSYSRLGGTADPGLTEVVLEQLRDRGLAQHSRDGVIIPLHPQVRRFVLAVLPQLLRAPAERAGYALQPITSRSADVRGLLKVLDTAALPSTGRVLAADLERVTLDLASVPIDEVLDFRRQHGEAYRAYARDLRTFVGALTNLDPHDREQALHDRQDEFTDTANQLYRLSRTAWRRPLAIFSLGIAGAGVTLASGEPVAAALGVASALLGLERRADPATAYSYLFAAQKQLSAR